MDEFTQTTTRTSNYSLLSWEQLNEMLDSDLVEVQNHTFNLHNMSNKRMGCLQSNSETPEKYEQTLTNDVCKLQYQIYEHTAKLPDTFTYPYGKYSTNTEAIIKKIGFQATLTCDYGINIITKDPQVLFGLKRISRSHGDVLEKVLKEARKL